ncbi:hypothetical protein JNB62_13225 [Microbacterium jejuense]|uniref:DUF2746 domain-containing protein n=1 Tax=Microbacterium jejuense TaxID=1263637 RepID=A0ABS7HNW1_9MICO|nr:hypothetical protein [Microbacterium jejuense]MBW9094652.1 hypothetical protein [Microbacterium jejuense]
MWPAVTATACILATVWVMAATRIDAPTAAAIGAITTPTATVLVVILQRTRTADHELRPNSGSSTKDQMNRVEAMVKTLVIEQGDMRRDIGGLRAENRDDRKAAADDRRAASDQFEELRGWVRRIEKQLKENP